MKIDWQAPDLTALLTKYGVTTDETFDILTGVDNTIATFTGTRNGIERQFKAIRENDTFRLFDADFNEIQPVEVTVSQVAGVNTDRLPTGPGPWKVRYSQGPDTLHETTTDTIEEAITWALHHETDNPNRSVFNTDWSNFTENACQWGTGYWWLSIRRNTIEH